MIDLPFFSPEQQLLFPLFEEKKVEVFVKRDDLIHPMISGNKWRKLKYILRDAEGQNKRHLVSFGGAYSNHLLALACAAAKFGFTSSAFVRGEEVSNAHLKLAALFGMELIFTDRSAYKDKDSLFSQRYSNNSSAYFIDEGGSGSLGEQGCSELIAELTQGYDDIFCAAGTGTTCAGLLTGIEQHGVKANLHMVPVLKGGDFLGQELSRTSNLTFNLLDQYHFGGYAKFTTELIQFIKMFSRQSGILIDQVYTGKLFFALFDQISKDRFPPGSRILAIHTGGMLGILGMDEKYVFSGRIPDAN